MSGKTRTQPTGSITQKWMEIGFAAGYQRAMQDIAEQLDRGGEADVREWVKCNLAKPEGRS